MRALVAGPFSVEGGGATAGDLLAAELVCDWLDEVGCSYDIAVVPPFTGGTDLKAAEAEHYSHAFWVCGPFSTHRGGDAFFSRFGACRTVGINLTMIDPVERWNPFDVLIERDSSVCARPDITFLSRRSLVPVVGVCLVEPYGAEYEQLAYLAIKRLIDSREISIVEIDTRLDERHRMFRTPSEVESVLAKMDLVITTRLHGTVLALKNGVPVISIDPGGDGCKIQRQAAVVGWPVVFRADEVTDMELQEAFDYCLTEQGRVKATQCSGRAIKLAEEIRDKFMEEMACHGLLGEGEVSRNGNVRRISANIDRIVSWDGLSAGHGSGSVKKLRAALTNQTRKIRKGLRRLLLSVTWLGLRR